MYIIDVCVKAFVFTLYGPNLLSAYALLSNRNESFSLGIRAALVIGYSFGVTSSSRTDTLFEE
jgi:hypothetical protein